MFYSIREDNAPNSVSESTLPCFTLLLMERGRKMSRQVAQCLSCPCGGRLQVAGLWNSNHLEEFWYTDPADENKIIGQVYINIYRINPVPCFPATVSP